MDTKVCSKCRRAKPVSEFTLNKSRKDGLQTSCKECHRDYVNQPYSRNREYYKDKAKTRRDSHREEMARVVREAKSQPCADCKNQFPYYVMDLDHVRGVKRGNVSTLVGWGGSMSELLEEIAKCEAVCSNCHRVRTHHRQER